MWPDGAVEWLYDHPEDAAGWDLRCVKLTGLHRPRPKRRADAEVCSYAPGEIILQFDAAGEALSSISGPVDRKEMDRFGDELVLWLGVAERDIRERTPRFREYVRTLTRLGGL